MTRKFLCKMNCIRQVSIFFLCIVSMFLLTLGCGNTTNSYQKPQISQKPLRIGEMVEGRKYPYLLKTPGNGWTLTTKNALANKDSDIELYGPNKSAIAVTYVYRNQSMDQTVQRRYETLNGSVTNLQFKEHRKLLEGELYPISYATYQGREDTSSEHLFHLWVTTIQVMGQSIELIVETVNDIRIQAQAELLAKSLTLLEKP